MAISSSGLFGGAQAGGQTPFMMKLAQSGMFGQPQGGMASPLAPGMNMGALTRLMFAPQSFRPNMSFRSWMPQQPIARGQGPVMPPMGGGANPIGRPGGPVMPPPAGNTPDGILKPMAVPSPAPTGGPDFGPYPTAPVPPPGGANPFAGPNNGTSLDVYRTAGRDAPASLGQGFTGIDPQTGYQYVNGTLFAPEGMTQSGDRSVMGKGFSDFLAHYGIPVSR